MANLVVAGCWICYASVSQKILAKTDNSYGTFVFNGLVSPLCFAPPAAVQLPNEPELEASASAPAAGAQARGGYDVLPTEDTHSRRD
jgi:hypothetical protein